MKEIPFVKFKESFPSLFVEDGKPVCSWGIECDAGWHGMIFELCRQLDHMNRSNEDSRKYFPETPKVDIKILQIKEKFGTLRVYIMGNDEAFGLVRAYEHLSQFVCEYCGVTKSTANVSINRNGWLKCLCTDCRKKYIEGYRPKAAK